MSMKRTLIQASEKKVNREITSFFKKAKVEQVRGVAVTAVKQDSNSSIEERENLDPNDNITKAEKPLPEDLPKIEFDRKKWIDTLDSKQRQVLALEINTMDDSWLAIMHRELTKPYFLQLKEFVIQQQRDTTVFPPAQDIYSWSHLTPLQKTKVLVIGQDPYHNYNQAHGLAFSVKDPKTRIPPSLQNIYKTIAVDYPDFKIPLKNANLTPWSRDGVLLLNTCLTVRAHNANSHSNKGWETFTKEVVKSLLRYKVKNGEKLCIMCWGGPAQKLLTEIDKTCKDIDLKSNNLLILKSCHPSPLSAHRGDYFNCKHFKTCNEWLGEDNQIDWCGISD